MEWYSTWEEVTETVIIGLDVIEELVQRSSLSQKFVERNGSEKIFSQMHESSVLAPR